MSPSFGIARKYFYFSSPRNKQRRTKKSYSIRHTNVVPEVSLYLSKTQIPFPGSHLLANEHVFTAKFPHSVNYRKNFSNLYFVHVTIEKQEKKEGGRGNYVEKSNYND